LGTLLRALIKPTKVWDLLLPHTEFAYSKEPRKTTRISAFKVVYEIDPLNPLDLIRRLMNEKPSVGASKRVEEIQKLDEQVEARIKKSNISYQAQASSYKKGMVFQPRDLVWVHLRKDFSFKT